VTPVPLRDGLRDERRDRDDCLGCCAVALSGWSGIDVSRELTSGVEVVPTEITEKEAGYVNP
jgi:hypothetical protein